MPFSPQTCIYKWVKLSTPWGDVRHALCMALFVNSVAFVNNMVEVAPGTEKDPVFSFVRILFGALSGPLLFPTFSS